MNNKIYGIIIGILALISLATVIYFSHNKYNALESLDFACYYDNPNTQCGKTIYCPTHWSEEKCLENNGTWELESFARDSIAYPEISEACKSIGGCN